MGRYDEIRKYLRDSISSGSKERKRNASNELKHRASKGPKSIPEPPPEPHPIEQTPSGVAIKSVDVWVARKLKDLLVPVRAKSESAMDALELCESPLIALGAAAIAKYRDIVLTDHVLLHEPEPYKALEGMARKGVIEPVIGNLESYYLEFSDLFRSGVKHSTALTLKDPKRKRKQWRRGRVRAHVRAKLIQGGRAKLEVTMQQYMEPGLREAAVLINTAKLKTQKPDTKSTTARVGRRKGDPSIVARAAELKDRDGLSWPKLQKAMEKLGHWKTAGGWRTAVTRAKRSQ